MLIQSLIKREGGSKIEVLGKEYHFMPNDKDDHVAEVKENPAIQIFLSKPHIFKQYSGKPYVAPNSEQKELEIGDAPTITPTEAVDEQPEVDSTEEVEQSEVVVQEVDGEEVVEQSAQDEAVIEQGELDIESARKQFQAKFGKRPHHSWKLDKILELLAED